MQNKIDSQLSNIKDIGLMTHVVAGYPNVETTIELIKTMASSGVDMVEIQIPFSDPMADGPTIMKANQVALDSGFKLPMAFDLAKKVTSVVDIPILFMTYVNIPYVYGFEKFCKEAKESGISGLIIPDIPFDEETDNLIDIIKDNGLKPIYVISPDISEERLKEVGKFADGFVYTTLKIGITGAQSNLDKKGLEFLDIIKKYIKVPIAGGFGISSKEQVDILRDRADVAVIGSHIINIFNRDGIKAVEKFLKSLK